MKARYLYICPICVGKGGECGVRIISDERASTDPSMRAGCYSCDNPIAGYLEYKLVGYIKLMHRQGSN